MKTNIKRVFCVLMAVVSVGLLSSCNNKHSGGVIVAGSTSVQPYAELLEEEFARSHPSFHIDVQGGGSSAGITAVQSGTADIGMSSRSLKEKEQGLWAIEIALDGLAVIVHPENPVNGMTAEEIRGIYLGEIKTWSYFGADDKAIHVIAREEGSGTRSAFEELLMDGKFIAPEAIVQNTNGSVRQLVCDDPYAIGFISLGLVEQAGIKPVKALTLDGIAATQENVINKTYKLFRPFLFVMKEEPQGAAKEYIDYILSEEGQSILAEEGLIPVRKSEAVQ